ncbi:MAG: hypothetical protein RLZZ511_4416 [Cyanobacteriota bacterium]
MFGEVLLLGGWPFLGAEGVGFDGFQVGEERSVEGWVRESGCEGIVPEVSGGEAINLLGGGAGGGLDVGGGGVGDVGVDGLILGGFAGVAFEDDLPAILGVGDQFGFGWEGELHESGLALDAGFAPDDCFFVG